MVVSHNPESAYYRVKQLCGFYLVKRVAIKTENLALI